MKVLTINAENFLKRKEKEIKKVFNFNEKKLNNVIIETGKRLILSPFNSFK
ncbi:MAG: hypothetical protein QMD25_00195 [Caldisericia bacterium]|jgi:SPX domain protein involved in polyphosphate accumulation|nr:hypothetical protein [Caldisericia bacterium]